MSADPVEIVTCTTCGTKNRIRRDLPSVAFRCGTCQSSLVRPTGMSWLAGSIRSAPELFFRFARGVVALIVFAIPIWVAYISIKKPSQDPSNSTGEYTPPQPQLAPPPTPPPFNEPAEPLPENGEVSKYANFDGLAPFEIKSPSGTNYLVKLTNALTDDPIQTIFVRGGTTVEVKVPLGTFSVKYAAGDTWYGYRHLFGPMTVYSKASELFTFKNNGTSYNGYTITLYKVRNGNLSTQQIDPGDF
jgi:hypothetical protein